MPPIPYRVSRSNHPGSSKEEIDNEPDWAQLHPNRIGYRNRWAGNTGLVHGGDESDEEDDKAKHDDDFLKRAQKEQEELREDVRNHKLINFREAINKQEDYQLHRPKAHPNGWRYRLDFTENYIKNKQRWPANVKAQKAKEEKEAEEKKKKEEEKQNAVDQEHQWKGADNKQRHNDAYASQGQDHQHDQKDTKKEDTKSEDSDQQNDSDKQKEDNKSEYEKLREKYSPQEIALLRSIQHEKDYITNLKQNDGTMKSPLADQKPSDLIDEDDQFTPDNWIPRGDHLQRLTGKHPLNGEPELTPLFEAGLITPNRLHYVRNHGAVPHLLWETHKLDVENGKLVLSMDDLRDNYPSINIAVALACDGNRRKELNMIKRSKGFNWGSGAVSCAYWSGTPLHEVLRAAGVEPLQTQGSLRDRRWVNFEGSDEPSEGKYATSIPLSYAMDPTNDVLLAYGMNNVPLPPDHGYPVRVMIPGYVGGRCVKWLSKIWVSEQENDSHYHIWDNRVLPSFVTEKDGEFAEALFRHPDTACNEQNLNSVVVKPAHGEKISLDQVRKGKSYRIEGYAYDGGGHEVQRVEVSLDGGKTWLYCIRKFPDAPIRHGNKFWTWLHWHIDVELAHLVRAENITVRCFNVFKNTQPERPSWNVMGMMNNSWYIVKPEIAEPEKDSIPSILFRHPCEAGTATGGWMQPSADVRVNDAKQSSSTPEKQFTREEIEKHDKEDDCWIVVDGKVYDATSVLEWHPGGKATILGQAGKMSMEATQAFESIHDGYAYQKLNECVLGSVTEKAAAYMKREAEEMAKEKAKSAEADKDIALQLHKWYPVKLSKKESISSDTRRYTFALTTDAKHLGLGTCQHLQLGFHFQDKLCIRSYTPTRPLLSLRDADDGNDDGTFDIVVKTYFPTDDQPGGALSNILDCMEVGEEVEVRGPTGEIKYLGHGDFDISGARHHFDNVTLILGGSGITPGYQLVGRVMQLDDDKTKVKIIDANKNEQAILLKEDLDKFSQTRGGEQCQVTYVLSHPSDEWKGEKGHVNEEIIKKYGFAPAEGEDGGRSVALLCGPPAMIQKAALPVLRDWGYEEGVNMWGF